MRGKFVTFEGCEGVGKSTQLELVKKYCEDHGLDFLFTREPGGNRISEKIREVILDRENGEMSGVCEALLYAAARAQLSESVIEPTLNSGRTVICDRYLDSSYAYQGYARGLGTDFVWEINKRAVGNALPDLTVFLDLSPDVAFSRKGGRDVGDRLENEKDEFHRNVYRGYVEASERFPERIVRIDCSGTVEETHEKIMRVLREREII